MRLLNDVFSSVIVLLISLQLHAATSIQRGHDTFFITETGDLMESISGHQPFVVADNANLKDLYLFRNRYIVGHTRAQSLYMLVPNEAGQECQMRAWGASFYKQYYRECNWIAIADKISQVFVDQKNILAIYTAWVFSKPTLMIFNSPEKRITLPPINSTESYCGLGCVQVLGGGPIYLYHPFENLEIINFKKISYDNKKEIMVGFEKNITYPLETVLRHKNYFKTSHWYDNFF